MNERQPILKVDNLEMHYALRAGILRRKVGVAPLLDGVSFAVYPGETVAIVGETAVGKTTLARTILRLVQPSGGRVWFEGRELSRLSRDELQAVRRRLQVLFAGYRAALNPRMTVREILDEPLAINRLGDRAWREARMTAVLAQVGLNPYVLDQPPHALSGGMRLRVALARALATEPSFLIIDEPLAALDTAVHPPLIALLAHLKRNHNLTYLFLAPDLTVAAKMADRIGVLYGGEIVEMGLRTDVVQRPLHPYTRALVAALPDSPLPAGAPPLVGPVADPADFPAGCRLHPRCPAATNFCQQQPPTTRNLGTVERPHLVACHHANQFL